MVERENRMENIREEICGGIEDHLRKGNINNYNKLKESAFDVSYSVFIKRLIIYILSKISQLFGKTTKEKITIGVFVQDNTSLCEILSQKFRLFFINPSKSQIFYCIKKRIPFESLSPLCFKYFKELYEKNNEYSISKIICRIIKKLNKYNCRFILTVDDVEMIYRIYLYSAKMMNIPTGIILHGLQEKSIETQVTGTYADWRFLWGESSLDLFDEKLKQKSIIMGYPYKIYKNQTCNEDENKVLFIGQPIDGVMDEAVLNTYKVCEEHNLEMWYRFHPGDDEQAIRKSYRDLKNLRYSNCRLIDDIYSSHIIIGVASTVLMEALIYNKIVIQINCINYLDFSDIGSIIVTNNSFEEIEQSIVKAKKFDCHINKDFLYLNENYGDELCDFIENQCK